MGLTKPRAAQIFNLDYKQATRVVTTSNITLSGGAPAVVDGVTLAEDDRVLVTGQSTGSQNGLYLVSSVGTGSNGTWVRTSDGNENGEIEAGMIVMVTEGTTYRDTQWKLITDNPITIGSTALTFTQNYSANSISSGTSNVTVLSNSSVTISSAGTANVLTISSTGVVVSGTGSVTGNINTPGAVNINSTDGNYNVLNISGTALAPYGTPQTWKFFTNNIALGGNPSFILFPDSSTQTTAYPGTSSTLSLSGNIISGNLSGTNITGTLATAAQTNITSVGTLGSLSVTGNTNSGNLLTVGQISATGTITSAGGTNSTGFAVGNGAVSNVGLGFFPTAGTRGDYAIRDYSNVTSTMYLDVGMGGSAAGEFQFRTSNAYTLLMRANTSGVYSPGVVAATGIVSGLELTSTQSSGDEGGQLNLAKAATNTTLGGDVIVDIYQNKFRIFENGGTNRGAYIDLTAASAGVGSNLLAGSSGSPTSIVNGTSNVVVASSGNVTVGVAGTSAVATFTTAGIVANSIAATNNGGAYNFKVGDDAWIGDINTADTIGIRGQQNNANGYIVFGNADASTKLGRAGSGPLTYDAAFSAVGNISGGNLRTAGLISATGAITGAAITGSSLTVSTGNVSAGNIVNNNANGVGNIGSATTYFNTVFAKATSAQYADLAENYESDADYAPGTVVVFGGNKEVTVSSVSHDTAVAGIISTNPSYLMNSDQTGQFVLPVALTGRVPCRVQGPVKKGTVLVSGDVPGTAMALDKSKFEPGCIVGKSLEDINSTGVVTIEVAVGRL